MVGARHFSLLHNVQTNSVLCSGYRGPFPGWGVKRQWREADRSPPFSAEVKIRGATPPLPDTSSLVVHRDFTFS
jgi:hypothetical protein